MALNDRLREARIRAGLSQKQVGELVQIGSSTISEYESGKKSPTMNVLHKLIGALGVDANFLFQDDSTELQSTMPIADDERSLVECYRSLDDYGKTMVNLVVEHEVRRCREQLAESEAGRRKRLHEALDEQLDAESKGAEKSKASKSG